MRGNPERRARLGVCFVGAHALSLGVSLAGFLSGSSLVLGALLAYASLPWWLLLGFLPAAFGEDEVGVSLIAYAVLNLVLHAAAWWWAWRRAARAW